MIVKVMTFFKSDYIINEQTFFTIAFLGLICSKIHKDKTSSPSGSSTHTMCDVHICKQYNVYISSNLGQSGAL